MIDKLLNEREVKHLQPLLKGCRNVVLTCHVRPDGDAVGSTLGLLHLLQSMGIKARVITPDQPPRSLEFLPGFSDIVPYARYSDYGSRLVDEADLIIGCDFNQLSRLSDLEPAIASAKAKKVIIDHHEHPDVAADLLISYPDMSSTCELVFRLIAAMGYFEFVSFESATCLCTGIITDTRNLSVNCQHLDIYEIMLELLRMGVNKSLILKETMDTKSEDALKLTSFALCERLTVYKNHHAAVVWLGKEDLSRYKYEKGDTEGLVNQALELRVVIYAVFMREDEDMVKLSMRSIGDFAVNRICIDHFDGGGHLQAAGGQFKGSVQECLKKLESVMPEYDDEVRKAADRLIAQGYVLK